MPLFTAEERERTTEEVSRLLSGDPSVEGVLVVGSLAEEPDRWSDIDLAAVVTDDADCDAVAADWVRRLYEALPVLHHFETAFGDNRVRGFLLANLLELDIAFTPAAQFSVWGPAASLFDRSGRIEAAIGAPAEWEPNPPDWASEAGFAWHDVLHSCTALRRGRPWQALWYAQRVRNRTLGLDQERRGFYAEFQDYADDLPPEELVPLEATLVDSLDPDTLLRAIELTTKAFIAELSRGAPELAARLEAPLLEFVRLKE